MLYLSGGFDEAIREGATLTARVSAFDSSGSYIDDTYYDPRRIRLLGEGSEVSYDEDSTERSQATLVFLVSGRDGLDMLETTSYTELRPYMGTMVNGEMEWAAMGVFTPAERRVRDLGSGNYIVTVQCSDRTERISNNAWYKPFSIASGLTYYQAISLVLTDRAKGFTPILIADEATAGVLTPAMKFSESEDPWQGAVLRLAEAEGADVYFDREGNVVARKILDPARQQPVLRVGTTNDPRRVIGELNTSTNRRQAYSGVICKAEAPWLLLPVSATVWDDDPSSPTWRNGPMGERPMIIGDSLATTQAQCTVVAKARLEKIKGLAEDIDLGLLCDPRMEVGDVIERYDPVVDELSMYRLVNLKYDLGGGTMQAVGRRRR